MATENDMATTASANKNSRTERTTLYCFPEQGKGDWEIQDDVVMGGRSQSELRMTEAGNAHFSGRVSLENDGGFCSFQQVMEDDPYVVEDKAAFALVLRGDGKDYSLRVRTPNGRHSYAFTFPTKDGKEWETISVPFSAMKATFHGEPVDVPNYAGEDVVEMQILIGNKKEESFVLVVKEIEVI